MLSYKYRIYPSNKQLFRLNNQFNLAQEMYNILLQRCKDHYKQTGKTMTKYSLNNAIKEIKDTDERFKALHSQVLQNIADRIVKAYKNFFRRVKEKKRGKQIKAGFPRFKKFYGSITYPQSGIHGGFKFVSDRRIYVSKVGNVPIVLHRPIIGKLKTLTIKRMQSGRWYACLSVENGEIKTVRHPNADKQTGIDVGLEWFASFSDGTQIENPRCFIKSERRLKRLQRRLSRGKGSHNRHKARIRVARCHEKIADQRMDFLHKLSRGLVDQYGFIAVEQLNINGMAHNHHLAKSISDASWNRFIQMLCYKAECAGSKVVCVNPNGTSQICSNCGIDVPKTLAVRMHRCPSCGFEIHRDVNSALNILNRATVGLTGSNACGDRVRPLKASADKASVVEAGTICGV